MRPCFQHFVADLKLSIFGIFAAYWNWNTQPTFAVKCTSLNNVACMKKRAITLKQKGD